jgi:hypothetical protein
VSAVTTALDIVTIPGRFNGPPGSANGGYAAALVAEAIGPSATVRLLAPPPLDVPLARRRDPDGTVRLLRGDAMIAEGRPGRPREYLPAPPTVEVARRASEDFAGHRHRMHPFPGCFVCGPDRVGDGMRIFPGPASRGGLLASPWVPDADLAVDGVVDPRFVWAALDCPSGFAVMPPGSPTVLATMTARLEAPVVPGRAYVVSGWPIKSAGRKHWAGSAIHEEGGRLVAVADALWITLREEALAA